MPMDDPCPPVNRVTLARGRWLEYLTVGWNVIEAGVAVGAGVLAGSTALVGFGIDSVIESLSGAVLLWRLREGKTGEQREGRSLRLVGVSFLALAAYVAYESVENLLSQEPPHASYVGIALAAASAIVMPLLARAKRKVASSLGSRAMHADSRQTDICGYLSLILLFGLAANALAGWWWADPVAALAMVPIIAREGFRALRGETCSCGGTCTMV